VKYECIRDVYPQTTKGAISGQVLNWGPGTVCAGR